MSLDKKILERIEKENLRIRSVWFFTVKNFVLGMGTFFAVVLGSLSLALLLQIMRHKWENITWLSVPYFHLILFGIFLIVSCLLVTKIDSLYKIRFMPVASLFFFVSLSFGYMTFASGEARKIERELEEVPIYTMIMPINKEISPESKIGYEYHRRSEYPEGERKRRNGDEFVRNENKQSYHSHHSHGEISDKGEHHKNELENKNKDSEVKVGEKMQGVVNEENSKKPKVNGVSKESISNEKKIETKEAEETKKEKVDSDVESASSDEDDIKEAEADTADED